MAFANCAKYSCDERFLPVGYIYVVEKISFSLMKVSSLLILNDDRGDKNFIDGMGASLKFSFFERVTYNFDRVQQMLKANCFHYNNTLLESVFQCLLSYV